MYMPTLARFTARDPLPSNGALVFGGMPNSFPSRFPVTADLSAVISIAIREVFHNNAYSYARNNPVTFVDPSGMAAECPDADEDLCGPDIGDWLDIELMEIQTWVKALSPQIEKWAAAEQPWFLPDVLRVKSYEYIYLALLGRSLIYQPKTTFISRSCPTPKCEETVTLAKTCIHRSEIGNLVFGFAAAQLHMTWLQTWGGGIIGNRKERTDADAAAIEAGYDFAWSHGGTIEEYFSTNGAAKLKRMATDVRAHCPPCPEAAKAGANHITLPKVTPILNERELTVGKDFKVPDEVTD